MAVLPAQIALATVTSSLMILIPNLGDSSAAAEEPLASGALTNVSLDCSSEKFSYS